MSDDSVIFFSFRCTWLDVGKLKDETVAEEFAKRLNGDLGGLGVLRNPEELWSAFKNTILDVSVDVLQLTEGRRRILSLKGHWIPLTRIARLSCSGS